MENNIVYAVYVSVGLDRKSAEFDSLLLFSKRMDAIWMKEMLEEDNSYNKPEGDLTQKDTFCTIKEEVII